MADQQEEPASLSVIDPQLAELDEQVDAHREDKDHAGDDDKEEAHEEGKKGKRGPQERKKREKKAKAVIKGSTADYKRKEANRLAAERSRSRVAEKRAALNEAMERLTEERNRLRAEVARAEQDQPEGTASNELVEAVFQQQQADEDQRPKTEGNGDGEAGAGAVAGPSHADGTADAEAEAQAHSRTILAALMSDAEIHAALGDDWIQHVNEHELQAATAEMHQEQAAAAGTPHAADVRSASADVPATRASVSPLPPAGSLSTPHARSVGMAIALHAEMERHLRDDLAATKAAIDTMERELTAIRAETSDDPATTAPMIAFTSPLPESYKAEDTSSLQSLLKTLGQEAQATNDRIGPLKDTVVELIDSRMTEATKILAALAAVQVGREDEAVINKILQPLKTHMHSLVKNLLPEHNDSFSFLPGSSLAPSIAPRRRGRPTQTHPAMRIKSGPKEKKKRSKLAKQVHPEPEHPDPEQGPESTQPWTAAGDGGDDEDHTPAVAATATPQPAPAPQSPHEVAAPSEQPELTTEEIISQLTHDEQDLHDLLRSHAEAEYDAQQQAAGLALPHAQFGEGQQGEASSSASAIAVDPALETGTPGEGDVGEAAQANFGEGPAGSCDICSRTQTTVWRKLRLPDRDLHVCNPCGMYHIKTGQIRPRELWGDGKLIRKRRKSAHPKGTRADAANKRHKAGTDQPEGEGQVDDDQHQHQHQGQEMTVESLGDVVDHDEFRASLGIEGLGEMITGFSDQTAADVAQDVVNVFGSVE